MVSANDVSRVFLQSMISRRVVTDKLARVLWAKAVDAVKSADENVDVTYEAYKFDEYISELNAKLEPLDMKLTSAVDEVASKKLLILTNTRGDDLSQMATEYTPVEIAYFRALVEQIIFASSSSFSISSMTALREVSNLKSSTMSKGQAEVVLQNFVANGWLMKSDRGRYSLTTRAVMELAPYIKANYSDDIEECTMCYDYVTKGVTCYTPNCSASLHKHCYKQFAERNKICPTCKADWSDPKKLEMIGEEALPEGADSRSTKRRSDDDDDDDDGETSESSQGEEDEEEESQPKGKKTKGKAAKSKKKAANDEDEDEENEEEMEVDANTPPPRTQNRRRRK